ncbi:hypothetical protein T484DRAFT_1787228, partial [Baffinella frigidus]
MLDAAWASKEFSLLRQIEQQVLEVAGAADPWAIVPHLLDLLPARVACAASPLRRSAAAQKKWQWLSKRLVTRLLRLVTRLLGTTAARNLHLSSTIPAANTTPPPPPERSSGADGIFAQGLVLGDNMDAIVGRVAEAAVAQRMPFPDIPGQGGGGAAVSPGGALAGKEDAIAALKLGLLMPDGLSHSAKRSSEATSRGTANLATSWGMPNIANFVSPLQEEFEKLSRKEEFERLSRKVSKVGRALAPLSGVGRPRDEAFEAGRPPPLLAAHAIVVEQ